MLMVVVGAANALARLARMVFLVCALVECEIACYVHEPGTRHL